MNTTTPSPQPGTAEAETSQALELGLVHGWAPSFDEWPDALEWRLRRAIRRIAYRFGWTTKGPFGVGPLSRGKHHIPDAGKVVELALCEAGRIMLRPGVAYRFTVRPGCKACADAAAPYLPNTMVSNTGANTKT